MIGCGALLADASHAELAPSATTKVVLLGTGTPNADPQRSGPAVAIVVNDTPYLVDFGPGVVRQAAAMSPSYGRSIPGLKSPGCRTHF
jgi:ribonuclease Z